MEQLVKNLASQVQLELENQFVERMRKHFLLMDVCRKSPPLGDSGFLRVGSEHDGGYIMWNDFSGVKIAYSAGIDGNVTWDRDMAKRGIQLYMYDHTIEAPAETHPNFHFFKTGLTGVYQPEHPELETLPRLIRQNGHENDYRMILKMDIEGSEYNVLTEIDEDTLQHFMQIVIEFHELCFMPGENTFLFALDKLNATHQLVHVHANNYQGAIIRCGKVLPQVLEARATAFKK